ncbi:MAG: peptide deformylase [Pseudomonadota bacterium]|jgi:peptide deformylase|nr:peptide deformylase [Pseudomonadota bacterium]
MSKRNIIIEPDPILRKKSDSLEKVDDELRSLMDDMLETMYSAPGIGLAAVQIGILKRIIVIDVSKEDQKKEPLFLVNPKITFKSQKISTYEEGCLSLPGYFAEIKRPAECHVEYIGYDGKNKNLKADGILSTCIQHEIDHLNGILFIDYLSKLKKDMIIKKLIKQKKEINKMIL